MVTEIKTQLCSFCSAISCGMLIHVDDGRPVKIEPNPNVPLHGQFCYKWQMMAEYYYHLDRINYPVKRIGRRGEGKWQRISWDQGLEEVASKLKEIINKHGPEAVGTGGGTAHNFDYNWPRMRFMNIIGSPNYIGNEQVCYGLRWHMDGVTFGQAFPIHISFRNGHKVIVIAAWNGPESWPPVWNLVLMSKKAGAKVIHIDPRFTEVSRNSDMWLQVRPGSDAAWVLAWIKMIIEEGWADLDFIYNYTNAPFLYRTDTKKILRESDIDPKGSSENFVAWDTRVKKPAVWISKTRKFQPSEAKPALEGSYEVKLADGSTKQCITIWTLYKQYVKDFTPEWAEELTWIPADKIRESCRMFATMKPSTILGEYVWESNNPWTIYGRAVLRAITGNLAAGGDRLVPHIPFDRFVGDYELEMNDFLPHEVHQKRIGYSEFPLMGGPSFERVSKYQRDLYGGCSTMPWSAQANPCLVWRATLENKPYQIRGLILEGCGALQKFNNTKVVYDAMMKTELLVNHDMFQSPTTMLCDYVFPASHWMERDNLASFFGNYDFILGAEQAVPPLYERRSDYEFWRGLALKMGQDEKKYWPWKNLREVCDYRLQRLGIPSLDDFTREKKGVYYMNIDSKWQERGFATPSGRVEIYSTILEDLGLSTLPYHREVPENPTTPRASRYPLIMISGSRRQPFTHSEHHQIWSRRRMHPDPEIQIHPETARNLDPPVADGDWVWIETPRGRVKQRAKVTVEVHPRTVCCEHNWWYPEKLGPEPSLFGVWESSINVVTDDDPKILQEGAGNWPNKTLLCRIYKA